MPVSYSDGSAENYGDYSNMDSYYQSDTSDPFHWLLIDLGGSYAIEAVGLQLRTYDGTGFNKTRQISVRNSFISTFNKIGYFIVVTVLEVREQI